MAGHSFTTERLLLRPMQLSDAARVYEMYSDDDVVQFIGERARHASVDDARTFIDAMEQKYAKWNAPIQVYAICDRAADDRYIGTGLLKYLPLSDGQGDSDELEVGWHLARECWGKGFATEAGRGLLQQAFALLDVDDMWTVVNEGNAGSLAVVERLGLEPLGKTTKYYDEELLLFRTPREAWT